jgi:hypothetical protein
LNQTAIDEINHEFRTTVLAGKDIDENNLNSDYSPRPVKLNLKIKPKISGTFKNKKNST